MRNTAIATSLLLFGAAAPTAGAQTATAPAPGNSDRPAAPEAEVSDFDTWRTPDSPAFVVIGVSPTEVQRPTTPSGLIAAIGGALSDGDLSVPKTFALEVSPYWLFPHPDVPVQDYRENDLLRPVRTLSLSVGTSQTARTELDAMGTAIEHNDSDIGLGFRTMLFQAGSEDECTAKAREKGLEAASQAILTAQEMAELAEAGEPGTTEYNETYRTILERRWDRNSDAEKIEIEEKHGLHNDRCVALAASTRGFQVDVAGALAIRAVDSKLTTDATSLSGYTVWASASYDTISASAVGMARLASRDLEMGTERAFDAGLRGIYKAKSFTLSAEALARYRMTDAPEPWTWKLDVGMEYQLTEKSWVALAIGRDFALPADSGGSLFSLANLKWSFTKAPIGR